MNPSLIIFDFDGTLADTSEAIVRTFRAAADENGQPCAPDSVIEGGIGLHLRDMFREFCGITDPQMIQRCIDSYLRIFKDHYGLIRLFPGVKSTLQRLKSQGIKLAVATNRGADSLVPLMKQLEIDSLIDDYVTPESVKNVKPAPDMARLLTARLNVSPEQTLVVGDTTYDVDMGHAAGCQTCAVTYGSHSPSQLAAARPSRLISLFSEL